MYETNCCLLSQTDIVRTPNTSRTSAVQRLLGSVYLVFLILISSNGISEWWNLAPFWLDTGEIRCDKLTT